jgi:hypothetical protein
VGPATRRVVDTTTEPSSAPCKLRGMVWSTGICYGEWTGEPPHSAWHGAGVRVVRGYGAGRSSSSSRSRSMDTPASLVCPSLSTWQSIRTPVGRTTAARPPGQGEHRRCGTGRATRATRHSQTGSDPCKIPGMAWIIVSSTVAEAVGGGRAEPSRECGMLLVASDAATPDAPWASRTAHSTNATIANATRTRTDGSSHPMPRRYCTDQAVVVAAAEAGAGAVYPASLIRPCLSTYVATPRTRVGRTVAARHSRPPGQAVRADTCC